MGLCRINFAAENIYSHTHLRIADLTVFKNFFDRFAGEHRHRLAPLRNVGSACFPEAKHYAAYPRAVIVRHLGNQIQRNRYRDTVD